MILNRMANHHHHQKEYIKTHFMAITHQFRFDLLKQQKTKQKKKYSLLLQVDLTSPRHTKIKIVVPGMFLEKKKLFTSFFFSYTSFFLLGAENGKKTSFYS